MPSQEKAAAGGGCKVADIARYYCFAGGAGKIFCFPGRVLNSRKNGLKAKGRLNQLPLLSMGRMPSTLSPLPSALHPGLFLIAIITAFDASDDAIFQSQVVHEAPGTMIVGPFLHQDQLADAIGLTVFQIPLAVLIIIINSIIARVVAETVDPFFLPDLDMVRFTAFGQHLRLIIPDGN